MPRTLGHERLNRYFTKIDDGYQVNKNLREMCVFTRHNLMDDPPFSKLDLISCRNVLIYLGSVQKNIIPLFHYALKPGGFLMLGASETAASDELFTLVSRQHRIYAKRETARKPHPFPMGARAIQAGRGDGRHGRHRSGEIVGRRGRDAGKSIVSCCQDTARAGVVVDEDLEVLEIRGKAGPYLELAGREGELQPPEADSGHRSVSGSREADPRRCGGPGKPRGRSACVLRVTGIEGLVERGGAAAPREAEPIDADPL